MRTPLHRLWQSLTRCESTPQVTTPHIARQYQAHPSFHHQLAVQEYNPRTRLFLLQDLTSQAAVFELTPVACEAKPYAQLETLRDQLAVALQSPLFYQDPNVTWIMQLYVQDERPLHALTQRLNKALATVSHPLTQTYQTLLQQHLHWISQRGGIFTDQQRAHLPFVGNERRVRLVLYPKHAARHPIPTPFIQQVAKQFTQQLRQAGVGVERLDGQAVYEWFVRWFNPAPPLGDGCTTQLLQRAPYPGNAPFGFDHSQRCFFSTPQSQSPYWYFDGWPHTVVTANQLNLVPPIGWLTGERDQGEGTYALFDTFPPDAIACLTLVLGDPKRVHAHLHRVAKSARGNDPSAQRVSAQIHYVQNQLAQGHRLLSYLFSVYLRAPTQPLLEAQVRQLETTLISHSISCAW